MVSLHVVRMPFKRGDKRPVGSGRKKGSKNQYDTVREYLASVGFNPFEILRNIASGELQCNVCRGKGKTRYQADPSGDRTFERTCQSCYGSGFERINPADRSRASSELCKYVQPQLKQIEVAKPEWWTRAIHAHRALH